MASFTPFNGNLPRSHQGISVSASKHSAPSATEHSRPLQAPSAVPTTQSKNRLDIHNLMISPPEQTPLDSFRPLEALSSVRMLPPMKLNQKKAQQPPSPPISPWTRADNHINATSATHNVDDPILYPEAPTSPSSPLFTERRLSPEAKNAVVEHMAARQVSPLPNNVTPPARKDYELTLAFRENIMATYLHDPRGLLRRNLEDLREDAKARASRNVGYPKSTAQPVIHAKPLMARPSNTIISKTNSLKHAIGPRGPSKVMKPTATSRPARAKINTARRTSATPEPRSRPTPPNREDKDFESIPNYCPPLSSLPDRPNSLKVDWKGNQLDLSKDSHRHLLHPDELQLAGCLRLDCATYLTSKRRIFEARLDYYHKGKEFRKTHAQQACKIDVNKASKLHTAYEKVGWFDKKWMQGFAAPH